MKRILALAALVATTQVFAATNCELNLVERSDIGHIATLTVGDAEAIAELNQKFPMNDCYQGVCAYVYNADKTEVTINFSKTQGNGFWARGQAAKYETLWTDNGMWLFINNENASFGHLFRGGCGN